MSDSIFIDITEDTTDRLSVSSGGSPPQDPTRGDRGSFLPGALFSPLEWVVERVGVDQKGRRAFTGQVPTAYHTPPTPPSTSSLPLTAPSQAPLPCVRASQGREKERGEALNPKTPLGERRRVATRKLSTLPQEAEMEVTPVKAYPPEERRIVEERASTVLQSWEGGRVSPLKAITPAAARRMVAESASILPGVIGTQQSETPRKNTQPSQIIINVQTGGW